MNELTTITPAQIALLEADGWTIFGLADAKPADLTGYKGINATTARKLIKEAQGLKPALMVEAEAAEAEEPPAVSVRLRRLREAQKNDA